MFGLWDFFISFQILKLLYLTFAHDILTPFAFSTKRVAKNLQLKTKN